MFKAASEFIQKLFKKRNSAPALEGGYSTYFWERAEYRFYEKIGEYDSTEWIIIPHRKVLRYMTSAGSGGLIQAVDYKHEDNDWWIRLRGEFGPGVPSEHSNSKRNQWTKAAPELGSMLKDATTKFENRIPPR